MPEYTVEEFEKMKNDIQNQKEKTPWFQKPYTPPVKQEKKQVGGKHYKEMAIQPIDYILENGLGFLEGNAIKYISRHRSKKGKEDLEKAIHYIEMLIEREYGTHDNNSV